MHACLRWIYLAWSRLPAALCVFCCMLICSVRNQHRAALLLRASISSSTRHINRCCSSAAGGSPGRPVLPTRSCAAFSSLQRPDRRRLPLSA